MSKFPVLLRGIEIDADNCGISITETGSGTNTANIAVGTYYLRGDGSSGDFCAALKTALDDASTATNTYNVTVTTNGTTASWDTNPANVTAKVRIGLTVSSVTFKINWLSSLTTFDESLLGFAVEKGAADANPEVSTLSPEAVWVSSECHRDLVPEAAWESQSTLLASGDTQVIRRSSKSESRFIDMPWVDARRLWAFAVPSDSGAALETFFDNANTGVPIELHEQTLLSSSVTTLSALSTSTRVGTTWRLMGDKLSASRQQLGLDLWNTSVDLVGAV